MNQIIVLGISFLVFLNLIIITARVYKLRLAEVNFLSSFNIEINSLINIVNKQFDLIKNISMNFSE